jgi:hypothetical protein
MADGSRRLATLQALRSARARERLPVYASVKALDQARVVLPDCVLENEEAAAVAAGRAVTERGSAVVVKGNGWAAKVRRERSPMDRPCWRIFEVFEVQAV